MSEKIFLTRNQLAKFLPTPEAIKAFENLFKIATQQTPNNLDEVQISAESALSMANYSLSVLDNVSKLIEALELQPPETPTISEDIIDIPIVNINECECLEIIKEPDWNFIKNHPTTISGYGITDAYSAVVADAPLTGSGTTSSHLSIPAATSLANGYLSSTDWSTFNNKQSAYTNLTNIGSLANSSGWLHNDGSGVFAYSTPTKSDVGLSNVTNNAQVKAITSTANKLVKFSDTSSTITNSVIYDDGTNVGIGTSSPATLLHLYKSNPALWFQPATNTDTSEISFNNADNSATKGFVQYAHTDDSLRIRTNGSERMRIDSNGDVLFGTTTSGGVGTTISKPTSKGSLNVCNQSYGNGWTTWSFRYNGTQVGQIVTNTSSTTYATSSDYRLKEDYQDMVGAIDRLKALKPINFAWKSNGDRVDGFLAHELQEIVPEAATGTKDAMREEEYEITPAVYKTVEHPAVEAIEATYDEDGNILTEAVEAKEAYTEKILVSEAVMGTREVPDYQGIDQSKLVPLLTKALQEAVEKIEQLEARIEALEMTKQS